MAGAVLSACWLLAPTAALAAEWLLPLDGEPVVTRPFHPPATPYGPGHRGVDLAGSPGQSVRAAGDGTIGFAAPLAGRGVVTVLHSGGLRTTYEPVSAAVQVGQAVRAGHPIGALQAGHLGCPAAACLHWGLLRGEVYLDPMSLLSPGPIRLLPSAESPAMPRRAGDAAVTAAGGEAAVPAGGEAAAVRLGDEAAVRLGEEAAVRLGDGSAMRASDGPLAADPEFRPPMPAALAAVAGLAVGAAFLLVRVRPP